MSEQEYRIDDLARLAGMTVRNVRSYQDKGLVPPPRKHGRVGLYTDAHLARLRLIGQMLDRGYSLANISELVGAWQTGEGLADVLGVKPALVSVPLGADVLELPTPPLVERTGTERGDGGIAHGAMVELAAAMRAEIDTVAHGLVELVSSHAFDDAGDLSVPEVQRVTELVSRLQAHALVALDRELTDAVQRHIELLRAQRAGDGLVTLEESRTEAS